MKTRFVLCAAALILAGCTSSNPETSTAAPVSQSVTQSQENDAKDFDGSAFQETEAGSLVLSTAGGTSENGKVPEIVLDPDSIAQIGVETSGFNGEVITVYVDGIENTKLNAGTVLNQDSITIEGEAVQPGNHTVEIVQMEGDTPAIYKKAQYTVTGK